MARDGARRGGLSQLTGAAGEALAQVHLLMRGWVAANVNASVRNNAGFDLTATRGGRTFTIAVKTIGRGSSVAQWSVPADLSEPLTLFRGENRPDYVAFIWFTGDGSDRLHHRAFVVPAEVVDAAWAAAHRHWHSHPKRDGSARKLSGHTGISFAGRDTRTNISSEFALKWARYENAWELT